MTREERFERAICEMEDWKWAQEHPHDVPPLFPDDLDHLIEEFREWSRVLEARTKAMDVTPQAL